MRAYARYCSAFLLPLCAVVHGGQWSGHVAGQLRSFPSEASYEDQRSDYLSFSFEPEFYQQWEEGHQSFTFHPFLRLDQHDPERTHADVREFYWQRAEESWELRLGFRKVFWGRTESLHLVDIINQSDLIENPDGEDKLGQPMLNLALIRNWGTFDFFLLPGFRERTFSGSRGRLRPAIPVDSGDPVYESGAKEYHVDWALRWSRSVGDWDIGLSHFSGTSREPRLKPEFSIAGGLRLVPYYDQIDQSGLDAQFTRGAWLWKLETIYRRGQGEDFLALTSGFEHTWDDVGGAGADVGILAEYLYDSRGDTTSHPFERDVFLGIRLSLNDVQTTELLAGTIVDPGSGATVASLELTRRLGNDWRLSIEGRAFLGIPETDPGFAFRHDDYLQIEFAWHF